MSWVVDTSVLLDVRLNDRAFGAISARCIERHQAEGLVLCPVSYVELAPAFRGDTVTQNQFLQEVGVDWNEPWHLRDTETAHRLWAAHVAAKRSGAASKRVIADLLIEAFAQRFRGVITRNAKDFATVPTIVPS